MLSTNNYLNSSQSNLKPGLMNNGTLEKAILIPWDEGVSHIVFMFNPTELTFNGEIETNEQKGTQHKKEGSKKVSFAQVKAFNITISKILFDTYETGEDVVAKYIEPFRAAVKFIGSLPVKNLNQGIRKIVQENMPKQKSSSQKFDNDLMQEQNRPPLYQFVWGKQIYIKRCFVEKLTYKLTMFLPNGTPVRAVIDNLTLKDVSTMKPSEDISKAQPDREQDSMESRLNPNKKTPPHHQNKSRSKKRK